MSVNTNALLEAREMIDLVNDLKSHARKVLQDQLKPIADDLITKLGITYMLIETDSQYDDNGGSYTTVDYEWKVTHKDGDSQYLKFNDGADFTSIILQLCEFHSGEMEYDIDEWAILNREDIGPTAQALFDSLLINQLDEPAKAVAYEAFDCWYVLIHKEKDTDNWTWDTEHSRL